MRRFLSASVALSLLAPSLAHASPFAVGNHLAARAQDPAPPTLPTSGGEPPPVTAQPTTAAPPATEAPAAAEPAPAEGPAAETSSVEDPTAETTPPEAAEEPTLASERKSVHPGTYNAHGLGVRGGITIVPTWILSQFLASHTNALCRGEHIINFGIDRGLTKQQGCNWYVGAEYTYRHSRVFDIVASAGYQRAKAPDGYWLDKDEWADSCTDHDGNQCDLAAADYTEVDMGFVFLEADFIGRYPVVRTPDVEIGIGGGAGIGLGIIVGQGVHQTAMGPQTTDGNPGDGIPITCTTLNDLSDFTKCTPGYFDDPDIDGDEDNPPTDADTKGEGTLAKCTKESCDKGDLDALGYKHRQKQGDVPPVIPVVNLLLSIRFIIKDAFAINLQGGFQTGFYFGGSLGYFFGGGGK